MRPEKPISVLIVEDQLLIRMSVAEVLREEGFEVAEAGDADEAIACLDHVAVDAVFTDVQLANDEDGFELADWISEHRPEIGVAVTSGRLTERQAKKRLTRGELFLEKPYDMAKLPRTLAALAEHRDARGA
jgi:DNA-binding NtrC family response regulator